MIVLHFDMDAFFAAIEERDNPYLKGKPIVVGADPKAGRGRGVVSTANYQARKYGIHSAMPISQAYRLCSTAYFLPVNIEKYQQVSQNIFTILQKYSSLIEKVSVDEAYLGLDEKKLVKYFKKDDPYQAAKILAQKIKDEIFEKEKLTCSCGIGPNKLIAKIASDHQKPNGLTIVRPNEAADFLKEKLVSAISGIGSKTEKVLAKFNVKTIGDLRKLSLEKLKSLFGKRGEDFYYFSRGVDNRPIETTHQTKSIGKQITFDEDVDKPKIVIETAYSLLKEVLTEAEKEKFSFSTLEVIIRYFDFDTKSSQIKVNSSTFDDLKNPLLKLLLKFLGKKKIRLVGVRVIKNIPPNKGG
jgi:DNA polymerase IV (DinB-like DNA polymerase)